MINLSLSRNIEAYGLIAEATLTIQKRAVCMKPITIKCTQLELSGVKQKSDY